MRVAFGARARPRRHEHVSRRASGRRSGRSCATRSRRCGGATTSRSSCSRSRPGRARCARAALALRRALPRAALRHRPRALRPDRLAGAARPARAGGRDAARQRPARPPLLPRHARGAAVHRARRRGLARVQREPARARGRRGGSRCCRSGSTSSASGRSRAPRRARGSGSTPTARTCCSRTIPSRPLKRYDRAVEAAGDVPLLTLGGVAPDEVPYWINAANAVLVPSAEEGVRAVGDRGARVRRARVRHAGRASTPSRCTASTGAYCAPWDATPGAPRSRPHLAGGRPARRRARPRRAVLRRRDGRARGRGVARSARRAHLSADPQLACVRPL